MGIIVAKFGGSSAAHAGGFSRILQLVNANSDRRYIVLSAPGKRQPYDKKITDLLYAAHRSGYPALKDIKHRYSSIIQELGLSPDPDIFLADLDASVKESVDKAISRGEYLSAKLFSIFADLPMVDAASLIHFDDRGCLDYERTFESIRRMASRTPYAVIPGFYGSRPDGNIQTFTRGGSDITGALIAAAVHADIYENWTDVDGLMSVDPKICPEARCHVAVRYEQMARLACAGAQVLHPEAIYPVQNIGVPTILKNTFAPDRPGTYISDHVHCQVPCICVQDNRFAVRLRALSRQARAIAQEYGNVFQTKAGEEFLSLSGTGRFMKQPVCEISVFGLSQAQVDASLVPADSIPMFLDGNCLRLLVSPERKRETVCALHRCIVF